MERRCPAKNDGSRSLTGSKGKEKKEEKYLCELYPLSSLSFSPGILYQEHSLKQLLPRKVAGISSWESTATTRMSTSRRPPLHTCGVSFLAIAHQVYKRSQDFNGPLGSVTRKMARLVSLAFPLVYMLRYQLLAILSSLDRRILTVEDTVESVFPRSKHVFDKVDELVRTAEVLPGKFADAVNTFPREIHQVPSMDWAFVCAISWLKFLVSMLTDWGSEGPKEKEIVVDSNCKEHRTDVNVVRDENHQSNGTKEGSNKHRGTEAGIGCPKLMKGTYKDVLAKGTKDQKKEDRKQKEEENGKKKQKKDCAMEKTTNSCQKTTEMNRRDAILELFESAWLMSPGRKVDETSLPRSVSYQW